MAMLRSIIHSMRRPRPRPGLLTANTCDEVESAPTQRSSLCNLPVVFLQHITSFLPNVSAASLALSNKHLCRVLGTHYWQILRDSDREHCRHEKFQFLSLLQEDNSQCFVCYTCNTLHLRDPLDLPRDHFPKHAPRECELQDGWIILNNFGITTDYRHLQLAMKHYRNASNFGPMSPSHILLLTLPCRPSLFPPASAPWLSLMSSWLSSSIS